MELVALVVGFLLTYVVVTVAVRDGTAKLRSRQDAQLRLLAAMAGRQGVPPGEIEAILREAERTPPIGVAARR